MDGGKIDPAAIRLGDLVTLAGTVAGAPFNLNGEMFICVTVCGCADDFPLSAVITHEPPPIAAGDRLIDAIGQYFEVRFVDDNGDVFARRCNIWPVVLINAAARALVRVPREAVP